MVNIYIIRSVPLAKAYQYFKTYKKNEELWLSNICTYHGNIVLFAITDLSCLRKPTSTRVDTPYELIKITSSHIISKAWPWSKISFVTIILVWVLVRKYSANKYWPQAADKFTCPCVRPATFAIWPKPKKGDGIGQVTSNVEIHNLIDLYIWTRKFCYEQQLNPSRSIWKNEIFFLQNLLQS